MAELRSAFDQIRAAPHSGQLYRRSRRVIRRIVMTQTRNHIYYRVVDENLVQVVTLWGAVRQREPRL
jgi:plasmid stabilization system protein ParE